jgi:hypothetical protein
MAIFLSFFTWIYTYKRNAWKFWLGFALSGLPILVATIFLVFYISNVSWLPDNLLISMNYALPIAVWVWAIVDTSLKGRDWYSAY